MNTSVASVQLDFSLEYLDLTEDITQNRAPWGSRIHIAEKALLLLIILSCQQYYAVKSIAILVGIYD